MSPLSLIRKPFSYRNFNATLILIAANVLVYLLELALGNDFIYRFSLVPAYVLYAGMWWQPFTYMFLHGSISHIVFNMIGLYIFGAAIEERMGSKEFLLYYLLTGLLAGLFSYGFYIATGMLNTSLLGASGAIFALMIAFASYFPRVKLYVFGVLPVKAPILVLAYTAIELFSEVFLNDNIGHLTHLAGFAFGAIYLVTRLRMNPLKIFIENRG